MTTKAQKKQVEEVREWLITLLDSYSFDNEGWNVLPTDTFPKIVDQILSELAILDNDQSHPDNPYDELNESQEWWAYKQAQINDDYANFRRILPK